MLGRFVEDAYIAGRFAWFYYKAPEHMQQHVGFVQDTAPLSVRTRVKWAWAKTIGQV